MRKGRKTRLFALLLSLAMLLGSVPVLAAEADVEKAPDRAANPSMADANEIINYVSPIVDAEGVEYYSSSDSSEDLESRLKHCQEGTLFVCVEKEEERCALAEYFWEYEAEDYYAPFGSEDKAKYDEVYDACIEVLRSFKYATGECYYDDIIETMSTLERQYAAFWEKVGSGEIKVIADDEEPLDGQEWIYYSAFSPLEEEHNNIYDNYWPTDEAWDSITRAQVQELITLFTTALNNVNDAKSSGNFSGDYTPATPSDTPETSGGTPQVSGNSVTTATGASTVAAAVEAIATTSSVKGVKSTVSGAYLIKKVNGVAFTTPLADIVAGYGVASSEKVYAMVWDLNPEKSYLAQAVIDNTAAALGAEVGPALNIELGKKDAAGKYTLLSQDGPAVTIMVGVPANFVEEGKTLAVVRVRPGGAVSILADLDADADTVTFTTTAGAGAYAIVKY